MDKDSTIAALRSKGKPDDKPVHSVINELIKPKILSDLSSPPKSADSWGFHLLIDCSKMNDRIDSKDDVEEFFDELIKALNMKKLTEFFYKKVDNKEEGRGLSAFQMITTSHISMHFDDAERSGYLDIFSCKKFDPKIVIKMIEKYFQPKNIATQFIYRDAGLTKKAKKNEDPD